MAEPTINDMMSAYSEDAVDFANRNFGVALDYSNGVASNARRGAGRHQPRGGGPGPSQL